MPFTFSKNSEKELFGVDTRLVRAVHRALEISTVDFAVHDGIRTSEEQKKLVAAGASKTMKSKHLDGRAVDLVPVINGKLRWEWPAIYPIAMAMKQAAEEQGLSLTWGGVWSRRLEDLSDLEKDVAAYVEERKALGLSAFLDGPHFEIPEGV